VIYLGFPLLLSHLMSIPTHSRWLHSFVLATVACTLGLIGVGGLVTSHGVGLAVPDWPNTYGYNMFAFPVSKWVGGILYEHSHRLIATFVGLLTTVLAVWLWVRETRGRTRWSGVAACVAVLVLLGIRQMPVYLALAVASLLMIGVGVWLSSREKWSLRWLGMVALAAVILQGVLGGLRVVWLNNEIGIFHGTLAQLFLLLLALIALRTSRWWTRLTASAGEARACGSLRAVLLATTLLILAQLVLGATMRHQHAGLAIPDFPLAYGEVWPDTSADAVARYNQQRVEIVAKNPITAAQINLQMAHRLAALAIVGLVISSAVMVWRRFEPGHGLRRWAGLWVGLIVVQFGLGAWTIWSNKAADIASLHVVTGCLCLVVGGVLCVVAARLRPERSAAEESNPSARGVGGPLPLSGKPAMVR
jgi:heme a synthase